MAARAQRVIRLLDGRIVSDTVEVEVRHESRRDNPLSCLEPAEQQTALLPFHAGIIIRVAAVVGIVSIGLGAQTSVLDMVSALGSNLIMISPAPP